MQVTIIAQGRVCDWAMDPKFGLQALREGWPSFPAAAFSCHGELDMIRAGVPQAVAMRVSGHRTTAVLLRYDIASKKDKREALLRTQAHREAQSRTTPKVAAGNLRGKE